MTAPKPIPIRLPTNAFPSNEALAQILSTCLPTWFHVNPSTLTITRYTSWANAHCAVQRPPLPSDASSPNNALLKVFIKFFRPNTPVLPAFETLLPNKADETALCIEYARTKWGAQVNGFFVTEDGTMGRIDEFLDARHLEPEDVENALIRADVARALASFHAMKVKGRPVRAKEELVEGYYQCVMGGLRKFQGSEKLKRLGREAGVDVDGLVEYDFCSRLLRITEKLKSIGARTGWCIHDVQYGNVLVMNEPAKTIASEAHEQGEEFKRVRLIDFENTMLNYAALDIGGHYMQKLFKWFDEESRVVKGCRPYSELEKRHFCGEYAAQWNALTGDEDTEEHVFVEAEYGYMLAITFDVHNMLYFMDKVDNKDPLDAIGLNSLFDEFRAQYEKMGLDGE